MNNPHTDQPALKRDEIPSAGTARVFLWDLLRLARPRQWTKSAFVLVGPMYGLSDPAAVGRDWRQVVPGALVAACSFALVSSACYIVNDISDADKDRLHPRKKRRPVASGAVSPAAAWVFAGALLALGIGLLSLLLLTQRADAGPAAAGWTLLALVVYAANVTLYSFRFKHVVMADVISLSLGFVVRVLGGCAASWVMPSTWLLNVTFFLAMFLAFCKRLGERRVMEARGDDPALVRGVQRVYTQELLRMSVVVTAVATLVTYSLYIQAHDARYTYGFNLLWLTMLPATYGLLRAIVQVERGEFDDPTELLTRDWRIQIAGAMFVVIAGVLTVWKP